jgi:hypothetical protein
MVIRPENPCIIEINFLNGSTFTMNFPTKEDAIRVYGQTYDFMMAEERRELKERRCRQAARSTDTARPLNTEEP